MKLFFIVLILIINTTNSAFAEEKVFIKNNASNLYISKNDPYESFNRPIFKFNMFFNNNIGEPISKIYLTYVPYPIKIGINNFFNNLKTPITTVNSFLQYKFEDGFKGIMNFFVNTIFGFGGIINIAKPMGLNIRNEDFGQTLAKLKIWNNTNYLVIPFLGSSTTRNFVGGFADYYIDPIYTIPIIKEENNTRIILNFESKFVDYTKLISFLGELKSQPDKYIFARESYLQFRNNQLYDGNMPKQELDDFDFE